MDQNSLQIKFDGQTHQIDANTLVNTLIHYNAVITEINKEYGGGSKAIKIKVNAIKEGSFIIDLTLVGLANLFAIGTIGYLSDLITIAQGVFGAYRILKGKPAKTEADKSLIHIDGDVTINSTVINVYNQPIVREAISKSVETAASDSSVEGINFITRNAGSVSYPKTEFSQLIYTDFDQENDIAEEKYEDVDATIVIRSLTFERGGTWQFFYLGFVIKMVVKDDALMEMIDKGERFGKGDAIKVKLRITKKYNKEYKTYENKSYKIIEFFEHIICAQDSTLPFESE